MADETARTLLEETVDFLTRRPSLVLRRRWALEGNRLAQRISVYLAEIEIRRSAATELNHRWALSSFIRVDPDEEEFEHTADGNWVRAWVKIGKLGVGTKENLVRARYEAAVASLPLMTREVFYARQLERLEDHAISARYGIEVHQVEELVAEALLTISRALLLERSE